MAISHSKNLTCLTTQTQLPEKTIGTGGLRKRIVRKGISWQTPFSGDEVEIHYSMRLEDEEGCFGSDSPLENGSLLKFRLGQCEFSFGIAEILQASLEVQTIVWTEVFVVLSLGGELGHSQHSSRFEKHSEVIQGLDEGAATMRRGERAIFTVPPNLAYGKEGCPPQVPPDSTLVFDVEMLSWNPIRDISGDGGIIKKITQEGEGWATPKDIDQVLVKYVAWLENGMVISKSEEEVEFSIEKGYLCPAMAQAVKTMRKAEKADLVVKPSYGFEQNKNSINALGEAAPDSKLIIHLELVSWSSVVDITGDKKVLKKILKNGEGFDRPKEGALAKVMYIGKHDDGTVFEEKGSIQEPFEYICSEDQVHEGLDTAIMTMKKGEEAVVTVTSDLSCDHEHHETEHAGSVLLYDVTLVDFTKEKPFWKMETKERLEACENMKESGNYLFKAGKFQPASRKYEKALAYVESGRDFSEEEKKQANALRSSCNLNKAACMLQLGQYHHASKLCTKVLEDDPVNVKALFRRSQAYLRISEYEKAEADIVRVLEINPSNRDAKLQYKELKLKQKQYVQYEAQVFSSMLSKMS